MCKRIEGQPNMWRITDKGKDFLTGAITIPSHALTDNADVVGFDGCKEVHIDDVTKHAGKKFDLDKLFSSATVAAAELMPQADA